MDIMLDIETLATSPDAVVLTFGAIKFDPFDSSKPMDQGLYMRVNVDEQIALGRRVDKGTVDWWGTQSAEVREEALGETDRVSIEDFTKALNKFVVGATQICSWCNSYLGARSGV